MNRLEEEPCEVIVTRTFYIIPLAVFAVLAVICE